MFRFLAADPRDDLQRVSLKRRPVREFLEVFEPTELAARCPARIVLPITW
jgi:hypothetical protein